MLEYVKLNPRNNVYMSGIVPVNFIGTYSLSIYSSHSHMTFTEISSAGILLVVLQKFEVKL